MSFITLIADGFIQDESRVAKFLRANDPELLKAGHACVRQEVSVRAFCRALGVDDADVIYDVQDELYRRLIDNN